MRRLRLVAPLVAALVVLLGAAVPTPPVQPGGDPCGGDPLCREIRNRDGDCTAELQRALNELQAAAAATDTVRVVLPAGVCQVGEGGDNPGANGGAGTRAVVWCGDSDVAGAATPDCDEADQAGLPALRFEGTAHATLDVRLGNPGTGTPGSVVAALRLGVAGEAGPVRVSSDGPLRFRISNVDYSDGFFEIVPPSLACHDCEPSGGFGVHVLREYESTAKLVEGHPIEAADGSIVLRVTNQSGDAAGRPIFVVGDTVTRGRGLYVEARGPLLLGQVTGGVDGAHIDLREGASLAGGWGAARQITLTGEWETEQHFTNQVQVDYPQHFYVRGAASCSDTPTKGCVAIDSCNTTYHPRLVFSGHCDRDAGTGSEGGCVSGRVSPVAPCPNTSKAPEIYFAGATWAYNDPFYGPQTNGVNPTISGDARDAFVSTDRDLAVRAAVTADAVDTGSCLVLTGAGGVAACTDESTRWRSPDGGHWSVGILRWRLLEAIAGGDGCRIRLRKNGANLAGTDVNEYVTTGVAGAEAIGDGGRHSFNVPVAPGDYVQLRLEDSTETCQNHAGFEGALSLIPLGVF